MIDFPSVVQAISQVGLPIALVGWGVHFVDTKLWPWFSSEERRERDRAIDMAQAEALKALAAAVEQLASAGRD
jgi:hypothetical protein